MVEISEHAKAGKRASVIDAPLLFESGIDKQCDFTIAVIASEQLRMERIINRDLITQEVAKMRIHAQKPDDFYTTRSTYVVTNDSDINELEEQLKTILIKENIFN